MLDHEQLEKISKKLRKKMTEKRYRHTIGVQYTAVSLAMRYGADLQQAALAGLLHDCAKPLSDREMLDECEKHHIPCNETEQRQPYLLHAKLGAYYAKKKYQIEDEEICTAIRYHTTGRADMGLLEMIIFTADYIEPHRKDLKQLPNIREKAFTDLKEAVYLILESTIGYLEGGEHAPRKEIEEHTLQAYEFYKEIHESKMTKH